MNCKKNHILFAVVLCISFIAGVFAFRYIYENSGPAGTERYIQVPNSDIKLWTESFGDPAGIPVLLLMGAESSGLNWPDNFCKKLAAHNYFVIRFDYRDVGASSSVNFKNNPYVLEHLASDSIAILDAYGISKANIVGFSMGGFIAQIIAYTYPERVCTVASVGSSPDIRALCAMAQKQDPSKFDLPTPTLTDLQEWVGLQLLPSSTPEERVKRYIALACFYAHDNNLDFDEIATRRWRIESHTRDYTSAKNHEVVIALSGDRRPYLSNVNVPMLVIHGDRDRLIPVEHAVATVEAIPGSSLKIISGMGHYLSNSIADRLFEVLKPFMKCPKA